MVGWFIERFGEGAFEFINWYNGRACSLYFTYKFCYFCFYYEGIKTYLCLFQILNSLH